MINVRIVYGAYKNIRNAAWQVLIDFSVCELPVSVSRIAKMADIQIKRDSDVHMLEPNEFGRSFLVGNQWYIVYDDTKKPEMSRFTIAHELGHIFLGHGLKDGKHHSRTFDTDKPIIETEADMLAARILSPACVLWALDLHTAEEISKICSISETAAKYRAERMAILYERNMFLSHPLERQLFAQFKPYIENKKSEANRFGG